MSIYLDNAKKIIENNSFDKNNIYENVVFNLLNQIVSEEPVEYEKDKLHDFNGEKMLWFAESKGLSIFFGKIKQINEITFSMKKCSYQISLSIHGLRKYIVNTVKLTFNDMSLILEDNLWKSYGDKQTVNFVTKIYAQTNIYYSELKKKYKDENNHNEYLTNGIISELNRMAYEKLNGCNNPFLFSALEDAVQFYSFLKEFYHEFSPDQHSPINMVISSRKRIYNLKKYFNMLGKQSKFENKILKKIVIFYENDKKLAEKIQIMIRILNNILFQIREEIKNDIIKMAETNVYKISDKNMEYSHIKNYLYGEFMKNDGFINEKSYDFVKPYWSNIIGYMMSVGNTPLNLVEFYKPYWEKIMDMIDYSLHNGEIVGNNKEDGQYIDPITYEKLDIDSPDVKILYSLKVTYYYKKESLLQLLENGSFNPFTKEQISWYDCEYIRS